MAVDVTQLAASLRITEGTEAPTEPQLSILTRLLGVSEAFLELRAPGCPPAPRDEAVVSMASYMYDRPKAAAETRYADAWRNSGAAFIVAPWVVQRLVTQRVKLSRHPVAAGSRMRNGRDSCRMTRRTVKWPSTKTRAADG